MQVINMIILFVNIPLEGKVFLFHLNPLDLHLRAKEYMFIDKNKMIKSICSSAVHQLSPHMTAGC